MRCTSAVLLALCAAKTCSRRRRSRRPRRRKSADQRCSLIALDAVREAEAAEFDEDLVNRVVDPGVLASLRGRRTAGDDGGEIAIEGDLERRLCEKRFQPFSARGHLRAENAANVRKHPDDILVDAPPRHREIAERIRFKKLIRIDIGDAVAGHDLQSRTCRAPRARDKCASRQPCCAAATGRRRPGLKIRRLSPATVPASGYGSSRRGNRALPATP